MEENLWLIQQGDQRLIKSRRDVAHPMLIIQPGLIVSPSLVYSDHRNKKLGTQ